MFSLRACLAVSASILLAEHVSAFRADSATVEAPQGSQTVRCDYGAPEGGPVFAYGRKTTLSKTVGKCEFACRALLFQFDTVIMPEVFTGKFNQRTPNNPRFCSCIVGEADFLQYHVAGQAECSALECWRKYSKVLNAMVIPPDQDKELSTRNQQNMRVTCTPCPAGDTECWKNKLELVNLRLLMRGVAAGPPDAADEEPDAEAASDDPQSGALAAPTTPTGANVEQLHAIQRAIAEEGIAFDLQVPAKSASLEQRAPTGAAKAIGSAGAQVEAIHTAAAAFEGPCSLQAFPQQCVVVPGPEGNEWKKQVQDQGCTGNTMVIKIGELAVAVTVFSVAALLQTNLPIIPSASENLMGINGSDEVNFEAVFNVRMIAGEDGSLNTVEIFASVEGGNLVEVDFGVSGADRQVVADYTKALVLNLKDAVISVTQQKPRKMSAGNDEGSLMNALGMQALWKALSQSVVTFEAVPPNSFAVSSLSAGMYATRCEPPAVFMRPEGGGVESYTPPFDAAW